MYSDVISHLLRNAFLPLVRSDKTAHNLSRWVSGTHSHEKCAHKGTADKRWAQRGSGTEVRMHDREALELFLLEREEGMSVRAAALLAGVSRSSAAR